jgi:hypothetical protein
MRLSNWLDYLTPASVKLGTRANVKLFEKIAPWKFRNANRALFRCPPRLSPVWYEADRDAVH